jgi:hypothetical protein
VNVKEFISDHLVVAPALLNHVPISKLEGAEFENIKHRIIPSFCYDNSFLTAVALDFESIIYGVALVDFGNNKIPIEHAWVKTNDGKYYDPTYQLMNEKNGFEIEAEYHSLIDISLDDYIELASDIHGEKLSKLCAVDFFALRRHAKFSQYFNHKRHLPS